MKFTSHQSVITPKKPVLQGGYGTRNHPFEGVHDDLLASIFVLEIQQEPYVWVSCDLSNGTGALIDEVFRSLRHQGCGLEKDHLILAGTHTHSGPNIYVDREPDKADPECFCTIAHIIAQGIVDALNKPRTEVCVKYADVLIDGLYSNRNSKTKLCDKHIHILGFFHEQELLGMWVNLAHHCAILGPDNYLLTADLFGAMRARLEQHYAAPVLMAQGNAGDMSNHMYRTGSGLEALDKQADAICQQIVAKLQWRPIRMEHVNYGRYLHTEGYELHAAVYQKKLEEYRARLEQSKDADEVKWLHSKIRNCSKKLALGDGPQVIDMPIEVWDMDDVQLLIVPGELGSVLGLRIKEHSSKKICLIWGYSNGANLGYMVERKAYEENSFESNISAYPCGVADDYTDYILHVLQKRDAQNLS